MRHDPVGGILTVIVVVGLSIFGYVLFSEPGAVYVTPAKAANARCATHGGVRSLATDASSTGTVVCADGIARTFNTRVK